MIFPEEKDALKKAIGRNYASRFLKWLDEKEVTNEKGNKFSSEMIRNIMNGYSHDKLENLLFEFAKFCDSEKDKKKKKRKMILKSISK